MQTSQSSMTAARRTGSWRTCGGMLDLPQLLGQHAHGCVRLAGLAQQVAAGHHLASAALLEA